TLRLLPWWSPQSATPHAAFHVLHCISCILVLHHVYADPRRAATMKAELAGYELLDRIGAGSAGVVHRARQLASGGRVVAVKRARQGASLRAEARALLGLEHPHVVTV